MAPPFRCSCRAQALLVEHGGAAGVRDEGLLESALNRPRHLHAYREEASLFELAASYAYGLARNHCFVDGNKRIALAASLLFLRLNGIRIKASQDDLYRIFLLLAEGGLSEEALAEWLEHQATPARQET